MEPRRVAQRVLLTLVALQERPRPADQLIALVGERLDGAAYPNQAIYALRRDIGCLRQAGFAVHYDRGARCYRLAGSALSIELGEGPARALALVRATFGPGVPGAELVQSLVERIGALLPEQERRLLGRRPTTRIELATVEREPADHGNLDQLERAIGGYQRVRFRYRSRRTSTNLERLAEPVELRFRQGHLYLRADDLDRRGWREFRTDRIEAGSLAVLPERLPPGRPASRRYQLRYRLSPALAGAGVSERFAGQQVEPLPGGGVEVSAEIESLFWAETTLLKYGAEVEVLEPAELRAAMAETARRLTMLYAEQD